jgi:signal transduction histidine kinase
MKTLKQTLQEQIHKYFDPELPLAEQSFNLLALIGAAAGLIVAVSSIFTNAGMINIMINLSSSFLAVLLLNLAHIKNRFRLCYWIIVIMVFMIAFPILFFTAGGYKSGMPCFFVFAIIFTALMLEKKDRIITILLEFVLYIGCCLTAFLYPQTVSFFRVEFDYVLDIITGFVVVSTLLLLVTGLHIRISQSHRTILNELNKELAARNEALVKYDHMKTDFLGTVAHEIKIPLTVIVASAADTLDLLEETPINIQEITDNQKRIEKTVKRIDGIVLDLTDTAAIENGRLSLNRSIVNLEEFIRHFCDSQFPSVNVNGNRLQYDFQPGLPSIWGDAKRLEQVMANLLANAVRHTKNGVITIKLTGENGKQTVCVTDTGIGMDSKMAKEAMNYYISSGVDNWRHGIGLYICRQIITAHSGKIWIKSEKGKGTSVFFTLEEGER